MEIPYDNANDIQPYMFEPNPGENYIQSDNSESDSSISDSSEDEEFEAVNSLRLSTLEWWNANVDTRMSTTLEYKCGHCDLMTKTIESFCCHEKATE